MTTDIQFHDLDIQEPDSHELNVTFHHAMIQRQLGLPKQNPSDPCSAFDKFRVFELGWYRRLHVDDHLDLHHSLLELNTSAPNASTSSELSARLTVINELLSHSPWIVLPGLGLVLRSNITAIVTTIAAEVLNTCDYQFSKGLPSSRINLPSLISTRLQQMALKVLA